MHLACMTSDAVSRPIPVYHGCSGAKINIGLGSDIPTFITLTPIVSTPSLIIMISGAYIVYCPCQQLESNLISLICYSIYDRFHVIIGLLVAI